MEGLIFAISNKKIIVQTQTYIFFIWFNIFKIILKAFNYLFILINKDLEIKLVNKKTKLNSFFIKLFLFILGDSFIKNEFNSSVEDDELSLNFFKFLIIERYIAYYLFSGPSNALYYYDGYDRYLLALKFKHSINLEYVFGMFPTVIISLIIIPSMYLLYSNETDINPCITVKIIGHQ